MLKLPTRYYLPTRQDSQGGFLCDQCDYKSMLKGHIKRHKLSMETSIEESWRQNTWQKYVQLKICWLAPYLVPSFWQSCFSDQKSLQRHYWQHCKCIMPKSSRRIENITQFYPKELGNNFVSGQWKYKHYFKNKGSVWDSREKQYLKSLILEKLLSFPIFFS